MNLRSLTLTAAVCLALAGLGGCNRDANKVGSNTNTPAPDATTTAPATTPTTPTPDMATTPPSTASSTDAGNADRTAGQTAGDAGVTAKVKAALLAESGVDGMKINVDTFNGRVTLKGEVPSKAQVDKASQVARGIEGVKDVDNRLTATAG